MNEQMRGVDWRQFAEKLSSGGKPFINGAVCDAHSQVKFETINPAVEEVTGAFVDCDQDDVSRAVGAAKAAFDDGRWSRLSPNARKAILAKFADLIEEAADELSISDCLDVGKPISAARFEVGIAAGFIRYYAELIDKVYTGQSVATCENSSELQVRRPRGVIAAIIPWNFPVINAALKLGPILAAGNTTVFKPSELSPRSVLKLAQLATEAGLPDGVFNVVPGKGQTGQFLASHKDVDMISFTGSTRTGKSLMRTIGETSIKPLILECGGKSPEIVFDDVVDNNLDEIAASIVQAAFWNQGQVCVARTRLYIQDSIYDALFEKVVEKARLMKAGNPFDAGTMFGPLASKRQKDIVEQYIDWGLEDGANLVLDGRNPSGVEQGHYVEPTIFTNVAPGSRLATEEIFGPVLSVFRFRDESEALAALNEGDYGLAATIWTKDIARAQRLSNEASVGLLKIMASPGQVEGAGFSHSGEACRQSGFGIEGGIKGLESYTRLQSIETCFG